MMYAFDEYELDLRRYELRSAGKLIRLEPQVFDVLAYLVQHHDRVVTREELLEQVWPGRFVSAAALTSRIMAARRAVGDRGREQRVIQTLHGRGYRFIADVEARPENAVDHPTITVSQSRQKAAAASSDVPEAYLPALGSDSLSGTRRESPSMAVTGTPAPMLPLAAPSVRAVGREVELGQLHRSLRQALERTRQIVFVAGAAGLGKTTLVEAFLRELGGYGKLWVGHGQCLEFYGGGEPYMPVLEALGRLCRGPSGQEMVTVLARWAPSWVVQMPWVVSDAELEGLQRRVMGTTRERMIRELAEAIEVLTTERPLILVLEDLHWSDPSTLDLIAMLARRREPARLFLIGTFRPEEAGMDGHPLRACIHELILHRHGLELPLPSLSEAAVSDYLAARLPDAASTAGLARLVHQRTDGNPLFMINMVDDWLAQGAFVAEEGQWHFRQDLAEKGGGVPDTLRQLIEQQLGRLDAEDQAVLETASVVGMEFSAAAVAAGIAGTIEVVEARCAALAERGQFLRPHGIAEWPDGTVADRHAFSHHLYRQVLYERVPVGRRVRLHRQIGLRLEEGYGSRAREMAAELAMHFIQGHDALRAVRYLHDAGEHALRRSAYLEAIASLQQGLEVLATLPDAPERKRDELALRLALGNALIVTKGVSADVEGVYGKAWELCQQLGDTPQLFPTLRGLWTVNFQRGKLWNARQYGAEFLRLAQRQHDASIVLEAHRLLAATLMSMGEFSPARAHAEQGITLYDAQRRHAHAFLYAQDPGVTCLIYDAWILWCLGYPDQARQRVQETLTLARNLSHPFSLAWAHSFAASMHQLGREAPLAQQQAEASIALCAEQGFAFRLVRSTILQGWALVMQGQVEAGIARIQQGMVAHRQTGLRLGLPYFLGLLVEAYGQAGQPEAGLAVLAEALATAESIDEQWYAAELHRLKGELLLACSTTQGMAAERCFHEALTLARRQQAKSLELRAAMSLSRLWQRQGERRAARELLIEVYGWFTEGFDTVDLQEATGLLEELGS